MECKFCHIELNEENWYLANRKEHRHICKNCNYEERVQKWREENPEKAREEYRKFNENHPNRNRKYYPQFRENQKSFYYQNHDVCLKYKRTMSCCRYHELPNPHLKYEFWKKNKVLVSRQHDGRFISWKEVD